MTDSTDYTDSPEREMVRSIFDEVWRETFDKQQAQQAEAKAKREAAEREAAEAATPQGQARAEAHAALEAERQRAADIEAARALIRQRGAEHGVTGEHLSDDEALELAGIQHRQETAEQLRIRREDALFRAAESGDPTARRELEALERQKEIKRLHDQWSGGLTEIERRAECERLGVNYDEVDARVRERFASMRGY